VSEPKPTWEPLWLGCKACGHKWDGWQPSMVPVEVFIANLEAQLCPECGAGLKQLLLRSTPLIGPDAP
jgi:formate dehydrogenase maturation protein FdhE